MTSPRFVPASLSLLASGAVVLLSGAARAECTQNSDCPKSYVCEAVGAGSCPGYACPDGADCPPPPPCDPIVIMECVPGPCTTDADCDVGMVCYTSTSTSCTGTGVACAPNEPCPEPPPPTCVDTTTTQCIPKYLVPCTAASDCGAGFTCIPDQTCWCTGGGAAGEPLPPDGTGGTAGTGGSASTGGLTGTGGTTSDCGCTTLTTNHCEPEIIPCTSAANCPADWGCEEVGGYSVCSAGTPVPAPGTGGIAGTGGYTGTDPVCTTVPGTMQCVPPYYDLVTARNAGGNYDNGSGTVGLPSSGTGGASSGEAIPPASPGTGGATGTGGTTNEASGAGSKSEDSGSCQMSHGTAGSSFGGVLALLGLASLARRRRRAA